MTLWKSVGVAAVVALIVMLIVPHVPFVRDLVAPKPKA